MKAAKKISESFASQVQDYLRVGVHAQTSQKLLWLYMAIIHRSRKIQAAPYSTIFTPAYLKSTLESSVNEMKWNSKELLRDLANKRSKVCSRPLLHSSLATFLRSVYYTRLLNVQNLTVQRKMQGESGILKENNRNHSRKLFALPPLKQKELHSANGFLDQ